MVVYVAYAFILAGFIYPIMAAWIWGNGWLMNEGFHDASGGGVVHLIAGVSGFWGAVFLGERYGKDKKREFSQMHLN